MSDVETLKKKLGMFTLDPEYILPLILGNYPPPEGWDFSDKVKWETMIAMWLQSKLPRVEWTQTIQAKWKEEPVKTRISNYGWALMETGKSKRPVYYDKAEGAVYGLGPYEYSTLIEVADWIALVVFTVGDDVGWLPQEELVTKYGDVMRSVLEYVGVATVQLKENRSIINAYEKRVKEEALPAIRWTEDAYHPDITEDEAKKLPEIPRPDLLGVPLRWVKRRVIARNGTGKGDTDLGVGDVARGWAIHKKTENKKTVHHLTHIRTGLMAYTFSKLKEAKEAVERIEERKPGIAEVSYARLKLDMDWLVRVLREDPDMDLTKEEEQERRERERERQEQQKLEKQKQEIEIWVDYHFSFPKTYCVTGLEETDELNRKHLIDKALSQYVDTPDPYGQHLPLSIAEPILIGIVDDMIAKRKADPTSYEDLFSEFLSFLRYGKEAAIALKKTIQHGPAGDWIPDYAIDKNVANIPGRYYMETNPVAQQAFVDAVLKRADELSVVDLGDIRRAMTKALDWLSKVHSEVRLVPYEVSDNYTKRKHKLTDLGYRDVTEKQLIRELKRSVGLAKEMLAHYRDLEQMIRKVFSPTIPEGSTISDGSSISSWGGKPAIVDTEHIGELGIVQYRVGILYPEFGNMGYDSPRTGDRWVDWKTWTVPKGWEYYYTKDDITHPGAAYGIEHTLKFLGYHEVSQDRKPPAQRTVREYNKLTLAEWRKIEYGDWTPLHELVDRLGEPGSKYKPPGFFKAKKSYPHNVMWIEPSPFAGDTFVSGVENRVIEAIEQTEKALADYKEEQEG